MSVTNDLTTDAIPSPPRDEPTTSRKTKETADEDDVSFNNKKFTNNSQSEESNKKSTNFPRCFPVNINIVNSERVQIGPSFTIYNNKKNKEKQFNNNKKQNYDITESIKILFSITNPVKEKDIEFLSCHMINEEWKNTARKLGYSDGQISQFHGDHFQYGIKEVIHQFLLDWIRNETEQATVSKLSKTLWETNHYDAVNRWSKEYKK